MFERAHHQRIATVLQSLDGALLRAHRCFFGGGTAMVLMYGEYRESVDMDFLVSDLAGYRHLRQLLTQPGGLQHLARPESPPWEQVREVRADQYGIRTMLQVSGHPVKFEIVLEGRIKLSEPGPCDDICGIATLTPLDMATSKLLANSDRWADDGVFSRDVIDLAMMHPKPILLREAVLKAEGAYGTAIQRDLNKAISKLNEREGWLERCMQAMAMRIPKAQLWQQIRKLQRVSNTA
jgi:Nucleotidyl transferase AbiEii toxin, Type IV TA system